VSPANDATSLHVRRARDGDRVSVEWLVERFTPLLMAQARYQLQGVLGKLYEPEDLVQEVWLVALPRLADLPERGGRYTPVLLKFLAGILTNKVGNWLQKHVLAKSRPEAEAKAGSDSELHGAADPLTGVVTRLLRSERQDAVRQALNELKQDDRDILILRGVEQSSYAAIGAILGVDPANLPMRYRRALERLRQKLPGSIFDELSAD
jgi:RNA polymerase sigma-70 factor (ECF subfamily)